MYLVDSNIWLEYLLNQEKKNESKEFLKTTDDSLLFISDFSLHSIGLIATRGNNIEIYEDFLVDTFNTGGVRLVTLEINDHRKVINNIKAFDLDFDDAYQLTCVNKYDLILVSYHKDFDKSPVKRREPKDLIR